ncbi:MAG: peptide transporter permease [Thermoleophilia bacterium]|nr:peptide transporter permease [Thermoleophilia bacterium]
MIAVVVMAALGLVIVLHARSLRRSGLASTAGGNVFTGIRPAAQTFDASGLDDPAGPALERDPPGQLATAFRTFRRDRTAYVAACILVGTAAACILLPLVLPWSAIEIDRHVAGATAPSARHWLGTDTVARDELARLLAAGRISLLIGAMVALCSVLIGALVGTVAGFIGGHIDRVLMWFVDIMLAIPPLPLLIALSVLVSSQHSPVGKLIDALPEQWRIIIVMSALGWMSISRVVRAEVMSLKRNEYIEAAAAIGGSQVRIMLRHIAPNCAPTMVVFATFGVAGSILGESFLSFLGVGVNPPTPTWGNMISESSDLFTVLRAWWLVWTPAIAILLTVLSANFVGDGLRMALDPQSGSDS